MSAVKEFIESRLRWAEIRAVETTQGGIDVMLRIDGTYSRDALDDVDVVEVLRERLLEALREDGVDEGEIALSRLLRP